MTSIEPVTTIAELMALDPGALVDGYRAGFNETPDHTRRDRAYWHGYWNGDADRNPEHVTDAQIELARLYHAARGAN